jgi:hypothetical protein
MVNDCPTDKGYLYRPEPNHNTVGARYSLTGLLNTDDVLLRLDDVTGKNVYSIRNFNHERLARGRRFIADKIDDPERRDGSTVSRGRGRVGKIHEENDALVISLAGHLEGEYVIRPVRLEGRPRFLFYRLSGS